MGTVSTFTTGNFSLVIHDGELIFTTNPHWAGMILNIQRWNQLAT